MKRLVLALILCGAAMAQTTIRATAISTDRINNAFFVAGSLSYPTIHAAVAAAGTTGAVLIPSTYTGTDTDPNPNSIPILDLRGGADAYRGYFYLPDFGARDSSSFDSSAAWQAGINAAVAVKGTLYVPPGTYKITTQLNVTGGTFNIVCAGEGAIIQFDGSVVPVALGSPDTTQRTRIGVKGCQFLSTAAGQGTAIDASHWAISTIENIAVSGVNKCIVMNNVHALYNIIKSPNCTISGAGSVGLKFDSTANENTVIKARIHPDANATCVSVNTQGVKLYDVDCETGALIGLDIQASARGTIAIGGWLEANQTNLHIAAGAQTPNILGMEINSGTTANFTDDGSVGLNMCGTRIQFVSQPCTNGSGTIAPFFQSSAANPASSGAVRLAVGDTVKIRNNANSADITAAGLNASDQMTVGGTAGIIAGPFISNSSAAPATVGIIRMVKTDSIKWRNNANTANITGLSLDASDNVICGAATTCVDTNGLKYSTHLPPVTDPTVDLASVATGLCTTERTVAVTGAAFGDPVTVVAGTALEAGTFLTGKITSAGNVKWQFCNLSGGAVDRASDTYTIKVLRIQ